MIQAIIGALAASQLTPWAIVNFLWGIVVLYNNLGLAVLAA